MKTNNTIRTEAIRDVIRALQAYYADDPHEKPLEYDYGYFDALGVVEQMVEKGI